MNENYYPWGGEFSICSPKGCVAVVLLTVDYIPPMSVAIYGPLKTENIGIEKIIANVISNPNIRYLVVCGKDIRGHRSGSSLISLHRYGIDANHRIIDAPGAIPYIENLRIKAIKRFQNQIEIVNLIDEVDNDRLDKTIFELTQLTPPSYGEPYIAIRIKTDSMINISDKRALHSKIFINYLGKVEKRGK